MKQTRINNLFESDANLDIYEYLYKIGVENPYDFLKANYIEPDSNYGKPLICAKNALKEHKDEIVYIIFDSDNDGEFSGSILDDSLRKHFNYKTQIILHNKNPKAHGLTDDEIMDYLKSVKPSLLIIPDAGTSDTKQCKELHDLGWTIICLDHHKEDEKSEKNIYAIVVNNQIIDTVENKCGSGTLVTWHFIHSIDCNIANEYISYVAISLLSDSMDVRTRENGTFIIRGLRESAIHENIKPLIETFNKDFNPISYSFGVIPKINATIRMGSLKDKLLLADICRGTSKEYDECIKSMNKCYNKQRSETERLTNDVDLINEDSNALIFKLSEKTPLTGLVANKLMSKYSRPVMVLREDDYGNVSGSLRSPVNVRKIFADSGLFVFAKGHEKSCGVCYKEDQENKILEYLENLKIEQETEDVVCSYSKVLPNTELIDKFSDYDFLWTSNSSLLSQPRYAFTDIKLSENRVDVIGRGGTTIKFKIGAWTFVKFFCSHKWIEDNIKGDMLVDIIGTLQWNEWQGNKTPQVIIDEIIFKEQKDEFEALFG